MRTMELNNKAIEGWIQTIEKLAESDKERKETIDMLWSSLFTLDMGAEDLLYLALQKSFEEDNGFAQSLVRSKIELYYPFFHFTTLRRMIGLIMKEVKAGNSIKTSVDLWTDLIIKLMSREKELAPK